MAKASKQAPAKKAAAPAKKNAPVKNLNPPAKKKDDIESIMEPGLKKRILDKYHNIIANGTGPIEVEKMLNESQEFSIDEIAELMIDLNAYVPGKQTDSKAKKVLVYDPKNPNAGIDLSGFDYKKLEGKAFREYVQLVGDNEYRDKENDFKAINGTLDINKQHDFQLFDMTPIRKDRYPGIPDTPKDYVGLEMRKDKPRHTTRISIKIALEHNSQILNQHSVAGHGTYYLLKK